MAFDHQRTPYMPGKEQHQTVRYRVYDDDRDLMDKLIGYNVKANAKPLSRMERYPSEWEELHKSEERLEYEAKQRKYRRREFATPYEKEWNTLKTPLTGYWKAKTPLYEDMCRRTNTIPDPVEPKYNTQLPMKRRAMRALNVPKTVAAAVRKTITIPRSTANYAVGRISSVGRKTVVEKQSHSTSKKAKKEDQTPEGPATTPRIKRTFFNIPGNSKRSTVTKPARLSIGSQLKLSPGARSSIARRLFGGPTKVVADNPLDELANALAPKSPQSEYLIAPGMGMGGNSVSIGLGGGYSGG